MAILSNIIHIFTIYFFLCRLTLSCSNQTHGCSASLTLERLAAHLLECNFNPKRPITCQSGCGITILFEEYGNHNCIQSLKNELAIVQKENNEKQEEKMSKILSELDLLKAEIDALKKVNKEKKPTSSDLQLLPTVGQSQAVNQVILYFSIQFSLFTTHLLRKVGETPLRWSNKKNINEYKKN